VSIHSARPSKTDSTCPTISAPHTLGAQAAPWKTSTAPPTSTSTETQPSARPAFRQDARIRSARRDRTATTSPMEMSAGNTSNAPADSAPTESAHRVNTSTQSPSSAKPQHPLDVLPCQRARTWATVTTRLRVTSIVDPTSPAQTVCTKSRLVPTTHPTSTLIQTLAKYRFRLVAK